MSTTIGKNITIDLDIPTNCRGLDLVWIEPGFFKMGASSQESAEAQAQRPQFGVELTKGFWIGRYPVTQSHWTAIMGNNPSWRSTENSDLPVENVSWHEANSFCKALSNTLQETFLPCFQAQLPFESQWEYACRAQTNTIFYSGDSEEDLDRIAWYAGNSNGKTHPVGLKEPNAWGLHDMLGNVEEWCFDPYAKFPSENQVDWIGLASPIVRSTRSDCFWSPFNAPDHMNSCSRRGYADPKDKGKWRGFRVCIR